jgi:multidrug efflux pump subunit AcrA (membrane-fusion protein)
MSQPLWRRPVVVVPAAIVLIGGAVFFGLRAGKSNAANSKASTTNEQLYTVQPTTMQQTVSASGTIEPSATEDLSFTSAGTVTAVNVKAGQKVKKGAVLATIDSAALQSAVQQANATYQSAQAQLTDDQTAGASSAQIASDEANVAAQQATVAAAFGNLLGASLRSPIDGTVATVNLTVGQTLSSTGGSSTDITGTDNGSGRSPSNGSDANNGNSGNSSTAEIEVVSNSFIVNLSVDTATVGRIKVGQTATATPTTSSGTSRGNGAFGFPGGGNFSIANFGGGGNNNSNNSNNSGNSQTNRAVGAAATGKVTSVGTVASSSSGVATFPVVIAIDGTPDAFHAGASASAAIVYSQKTNVLAVPVNAVTQSGGESYVTVSTNGKTSKRTVTTGTTANGQIEITSGLQSGDQVVVTLPNFTRNRNGNGNTNGGQFPGGGQFQFPGGGGSKP